MMEVSNMKKCKMIFGKNNMQDEKSFVKESLAESLKGLSKIMLNGNKPSARVSMENTIAIIKKGLNIPSVKSGGIIIFPSSFNINTKIFLDRIKNIYYHSYDDPDINKENIERLQIGKYFSGFYYDFECSEKYDKSCFCIELLGISSSYLEIISEQLGKAFQQHSLLIMDYADGKIYLYNKRIKI